jgi:hypothetical protein
MIKYCIIFFSQILFNIFKTHEIIYTQEKKIKELLINSVLINLISIGSMYISLEQLLSNNMIIIPIYILGSVIGKYLAFVKLNKK